MEPTTPKCECPKRQLRQIHRSRWIKFLPVRKFVCSNCQRTQFRWNFSRHRDSEINSAGRERKPIQTWSDVFYWVCGAFLSGMLVLYVLNVMDP